MRQVVISDWRRISTIVAEVAAAPPTARSELDDRPRLKFSMFWGALWNEYLNGGGDARSLRPRDADQTGHFYPAWRGRPAIIDLVSWAGQRPRRLSPKALAVLRQYGVPVKLVYRRS